MKKKEKKTKRIWIVLIVIILCIVSGIGTYFITYKIDKSKKGGDVKLTVTFEDTDSYSIPSTKTMTRDEAMDEWPYIMHLSNKGDGIGLYQILIKEDEESTIKREYLSYVLYQGDTEVVTGKLKDLQENVLYTSQIEGRQDQDYSLYIWVSKDLPEKAEDTVLEEAKEMKYQYKLEFNTIKAGGPGF